MADKFLDNDISNLYDLLLKIDKEMQIKEAGRVIIKFSAYHEYTEEYRSDKVKKQYCEGFLIYLQNQKAILSYKLLDEGVISEHLEDLLLDPAFTIKVSVDKEKFYKFKEGVRQKREKRTNKKLEQIRRSSIQQQNKDGISQKKLLTIKELSQYLSNIPVPTIRDWIRRKEIPYSQPNGRGGRIYFDRKKIDELFDGEGKRKKY